MRAFIALPIPDASAEVLQRLAEGVPVGRPAPRDNLHLTLTFLGDAEEGVLEDLHDLLSALRAPAPEIVFEGLDTFGEAHTGLVFATVRRTSDLMDLQSRVEAASRRAGLDLPRRRFRPHVTIARSKRPPRGVERDRMAGFLARNAQPGIPGFTAATMALYRSTLGPGGAIHEPLALYPLAAAPPAGHADP